VSPSFPLWAAFVAAILAMLAVDLLASKHTFRSAAIWSGVWALVGAAFGLLLLVWEGGGVAGEYWAGFLMEKSLSIDNVFVFAVLLAALRVPEALQDRVLTFGIVGALGLRAIFIVAGIAVIEAFHPAIYVFGALLVLTGIRLAVKHDDSGEEPRIARLARRLSRGHVVLPALAAVAAADVLFAVDSVPAVLAITTDTFVVFAANAFALLGLRALYGLVTGMADRFAYLHYGLAALLVFVGGKMLTEDLVGKAPIGVSLGVIAAILAVSIGASMLKTRGPRRPAEPLPAGG
jgi:tellurite resistance protein TerC